MRKLILILFFMSTPLFAKETAIFAGGCFWCMQAPFDQVEGVIETLVGYTGGKKKNPSYEDVSHGETTHYEAIKIDFDPNKISYSKLLQVFWHNINPTQANGQFADIGHQYQTAIFYLNDDQKKLALKSIKDLEKSKKFKKPIATKVIKASEFYPAEKYHQKYYQKNPVRYKYYKIGSGRAAYLKKTWGKD